MLQRAGQGLSLDEIAGLTYATNYQWNLQFLAPLPTGVPGFPASEDINIRCSSATPPVATNNPLKIAMRQHAVNQPGHITYDGGFVLTLNETVDHRIKTWITNWREACFQTRTGYQEDKAAVVATIRLQMLNRKNDDPYNFTIYSAFLSAYTYPEATSNEQAGIYQPQMTLTYDYFEESRG